MKRKYAVVADLDQTLVDTAHLSPLAYCENPNFAEFHRLAVLAKPIPYILRVCHSWVDIGVHVVISTARSEEWESLTLEWLRREFDGYAALYMRNKYDSREDWLVKEDNLWEIQSKYHVLKAYDDNPQVIEKVYWANDIPTMTLPHRRG